MRSLHDHGRTPVSATDRLERTDKRRKGHPHTPTSSTQPNPAAARRAVSTAYYAAFHALTASNADAFVGTPTDQLTTDAWLRVYRRLDHGNAREQLRQNRQCFSARAATFADLFLDLQNERHNSDYNPQALFTTQTATTWLNNTEAAIIDFFQTTTTERAAIAVLTLTRTR